MSDEQLRRDTDKTQGDIEKLIALENNHEQRAILIVLNAINRSLIANTLSTQATSSNLEDHIRVFQKHIEQYDKNTSAEQALVNRGRGVWWVLSSVLVLAQLIAVGIWTETRSSLNINEQAINEIKITETRLQARLENVERITKIK